VLVQPKSGSVRGIQLRSGLAVVVVAALAPSVAAQANRRITFGIQWHGPTVGQPSSSPGTPITEGDLLLPALGDPAFGPLPRPQIFLNAGQLGITRYSTCVGHQGGTPCGIEVDALSFGTDAQFRCDQPSARLFFSVDEQAVGSPSSTLVPSVRSEAAAGVWDVAADVFVPLTLPPGPLPPHAVPSESVGTIDGNGLVSGSGSHYRGLGLVEPNPPGLPPDPGDNLDSLVMSPLPGPNGKVYFSLDASFVDPVLGIPNSGSAAAAGVPPAAVLVKQLSGGGFTIYATPNQLGLDFFGAGTDDLDALILSENGDGVFEPSQTPCDWVAPLHGLVGPTDMLLFSVRRGSAVVGMPDSIFGLPIEPGDLLTTPKAGGLSPFPGIYVAAEDLGLATTRTDGVTTGDELDAASTSPDPWYDCNHNGVEDSVDIATGASADANHNGIPDECEQSTTGYCFCTAGLGPCGNDDASAGCANSTGSGAALGSSGTTSFDTDDLVLSATGMPTNKLGVWLLSHNQAQATLGDGLRCVGSPFHRFGTFNTGATGSGTKGPGIIASSCATLPASYCIVEGSTWNFQTWYRNLTGPCGHGSNLTNGVQVVFTP
jgi:hypothetical protein